MAAWTPSFSHASNSMSNWTRTAIASVCGTPCEPPETASAATRTSPTRCWTAPAAGGPSAEGLRGEQEPAGRASARCVGAARSAGAGRSGCGRESRPPWGAAPPARRAAPGVRWLADPATSCCICPREGAATDRTAPLGGEKSSGGGRGRPGAQDLGPHYRRQQRQRAPLCAVRRAGRGAAAAAAEACRDRPPRSLKGAGSRPTLMRRRLGILQPPASRLRQSGAPLGPLRLILADPPHGCDPRPAVRTAGTAAASLRGGGGRGSMPRSSARRLGGRHTGDGSWCVGVLPNERCWRSCRPRRCRLPAAGEAGGPDRTLALPTIRTRLGRSRAVCGGYDANSSCSEARPAERNSPRALRRTHKLNYCML